MESKVLKKNWHRDYGDKQKTFLVMYEFCKLCIYIVLFTKLDDPTLSRLANSQTRKIK